MIKVVKTTSNYLRCKSCGSSNMEKPIFEIRVGIDRHNNIQLSTMTMCNLCINRMFHVFENAWTEYINGIEVE